MKWVDIPPVWLVSALVLAWWQPRLFGGGLSFGGIWSWYAGVFLVLAGVGLMGAAVWQFQRHKTSVIPHERPSAMITRGVFALSRNPIYLGDVLVLAGLVLIWDAVLSLILVPVFVVILERRFILPEEMRLSDAFGAAFAEYRKRTRRWI